MQILTEQALGHGLVLSTINLLHLSHRHQRLLVRSVLNTAQLELIELIVVSLGSTLETDFGFLLEHGSLRRRAILTPDAPGTLCSHHVWADNILGRVILVGIRCIKI